MSERLGETKLIGILLIEKKKKSFIGRVVETGDAVVAQLT